MVTQLALRSLPHSWRPVLECVTEKLIDCRAVIAGGAIRDLLLGAESIVKDLDIFVLGPGESTIQNLSETFGEPPWSAIRLRFGRNLRGRSRLAVAGA